jgi:hypothetical protein
MMRFLLPAAMAVALMTSAEAAAPATPFDSSALFFSEKVLQGALSDIARMQEAELRAFTHYLSECDGNREEHACEAAYNFYRIEFGATHPPAATRPLDNLMVARASRETNARVGLERGPIDFDTLAKQVVIISELEDGASARFRALRNGKE